MGQLQAARIENLPNPNNHRTSYLIVPYHRSYRFKLTNHKVSFLHMQPYFLLHICLHLCLIFTAVRSLPMISNVNKLKNISSLKNSFFALRHGQSLANVAKIISSDPAISTVEHGLSDIGKTQVASSADLFAQQYLSNKDTESVAIFSR